MAGLRMGRRLAFLDAGWGIMIGGRERGTGAELGRLTLRWNLGAMIEERDEWDWRYGSLRKEG